MPKTTPLKLIPIPEILARKQPAVSLELYNSTALHERIAELQTISTKMQTAELLGWSISEYARDLQLKLTQLFNESHAASFIFAAYVISSAYG